MIGSWAHVTHARVRLMTLSGGRAWRKEAGRWGCSLERSISLRTARPQAILLHHDLVPCCPALDYGLKPLQTVSPNKPLLLEIMSQVCVSVMRKLLRQSHRGHSSSCTRVTKSSLQKQHFTLSLEDELQIMREKGNLQGQWQNNFTLHQMHLWLREGETGLLESTSKT